MSENQAGGSPNESGEQTAFEKLQTAVDHEDRADRLRAEAKRDVLNKVADTIPFDAEIAVRLQDDAFVVTCVPETLPNSIAEEFGEDVDVSTPIRFTIGDVEPDRRIKNLKQLIGEIGMEYDDGAPIDVVRKRAADLGLSQSKAEREIEKLKQKGEVYEPSSGYLRTT